MIQRQQIFGQRIARTRQMAVRGLGRGRSQLSSNTSKLLRHATSWPSLILTQIENRSLSYFPRPHLTVLHHAEITVMLAIFVADLDPKKQWNVLPFWTVPSAA